MSKIRGVHAIYSARYCEANLLPHCGVVSLAFHHTMPEEYPKREILRSSLPLLGRMFPRSCIEPFFQRTLSTYRNQLEQSLSSHVINQNHVHNVEFSRNMVSYMAFHTLNWSTLDDETITLFIKAVLEPSNAVDSSELDRNGDLLWGIMKDTVSYISQLAVSNLSMNIGNGSVRPRRGQCCNLLYIQQPFIPT